MRSGRRGAPASLVSGQHAARMASVMGQSRPMWRLALWHTDGRMIVRSNHVCVLSSAPQRVWTPFMRPHNSEPKYKQFGWQFVEWYAVPKKTRMSHQFKWSPVIQGYKLIPVLLGLDCIVCTGCLSTQRLPTVPSIKIRDVILGDMFLIDLHAVFGNHCYSGTVLKCSAGIVRKVPLEPAVREGSNPAGCETYSANISTK